MRLAEVEGFEAENAGLLANRAGIGEDRLRIELKRKVLSKPHRLHELDKSVKSHAHLLDHLAGARMRRDNDRQLEGLRNLIKAVDEIEEVPLLGDVLLAVGGNDEVLVLPDAHLLQDRRRVLLHFGKLHGQDLEHRRSGLDDLVRRQSLAQQVFAGNRGVAEVDVRDMVHDLAVGLLGDALVEAAVAGLHVEDRDMALLRGDGAEAAVCVPEDEERIRLHLLQNGIDRLEDLSGRHGGVPSRGVQEAIRLLEPEVLEEHLVELVVVVLPRVHQDMVDRRTRVQLLQHTRETDDLRTRPHDCHDFKLLHRNPF